MALKVETRQIADELTKWFLVPFTIEDQIKEFQESQHKLPKSFQRVSETFIDRLNATIQTTAIPFLLANEAAYDNQYQRISIAERIRARSIAPHTGENLDAVEIRRNDAAKKTAKSKMDAFCTSEEGTDSLVSETAKFLLHLHHKPNVESVAREVLLQGTVATWSTLEMLISDGLTLLLNHQPDLVGKLLSDPIAKRKFELPKISVEDLAARGFNLSNQMGQLLFGERDLSNFQTLKSACEALINSAELREKLSHPIAWQLNQNRHLIAHRRGIVDEEYIRKTRSKLGVGDQLVVSPQEFEEGLVHAMAVGTKFLAGLVALTDTSSTLSNG